MSRPKRLARRTRRFLAAMALAAAVPTAPAAAQAPALAGLLERLIGGRIQLSGTVHTFHWAQDDNAALIARQLNGSLVQQIALSSPQGSTSGGVTSEFDPETNTFRRTTQSFGPIFAERAETLGRRRANFGVSYIGWSFDSIDGLSLAGDELRFDMVHTDTNGDGSTLDPHVEGDLISVRARLDLRTETLLAYASYGLTDRLDLSLGIPLVAVSLTAALDAEIEELATGGDPQSVHLFPDGNSRAEFAESGEASGLGDLVVRAKYGFARREGRALAAIGELRLPTGDDDNLLGAGTTQLGLWLVGSASFGRLAPHVNLGYVTSSGSSAAIGELPDRVHLTVGFDAPVNELVTLAGDLLWRNLLDARQVRISKQTHIFRPGAGSQRIETTLRDDLGSEVDDLTQTFATFGARIKLSPRRDYLVTASLLQSLGSDGLQDDDPVVLIGFDFYF